MSNAAALNALEYEAETVFGENVETFATHRIPTATPVDVSGLTHAKQASGRVVQRLQDGTPDILGVQGGSIKVKMWLAGHGSTTAGATTLDAIETFLSYVFGYATLSAASGSTFAAAGTAGAPNTTASGTFAAGSLMRAGTAGNGSTIAADAKGNGQFAAIHDHTATVMTLLTALDGAPVVADVLYSACNLYLPEDATDAQATITGLRLRALSANLIYEMHGCVCTAITINALDPSNMPYLELTFAVSRWFTSATGTYPSSVTSNKYNPSPVAQGSLFVNTVGTSTRVKRVCRHFSVTVKLGVQLLMGPGALGQYQAIIGAKRTPSTITVKWTEDADAAPTATPSADQLFILNNQLHMLYTLSCTDGSAVGIYFPNLCVTGARPVQTANENINRMSVEATAYTGTTTTSQLTMSAMRIAFA